MPTFVKRPVAVEMIQWTGTNIEAVDQFCRHDASNTFAAPHIVGPGDALTFYCLTSQSEPLIQPGDWLARERDGRGVYPINQREQAETYMPSTVAVPDAFEIPAGSRLITDPVELAREAFDGVELTPTQRLSIFEIVTRATRF